MRARVIAVIGFLVCAALAVSCSSLLGIKDPTLGGDGGGSSDGALPTSDGSAPPIDAARPDSAPRPDAAPGTPVITRVAWAPLAGCFSGFPAGYSVTTTVVDSDTPAIDIDVTGTVDGCSAINSATANISCQTNSGPMNGTVTATDPENHTWSENFTITPCTSGSVP
ncbi:MAG: hypothetical protein IT370_22860 [Deltaproteobacteria bacterium]|nr:hypothetical protein [Deltaproteobacteria bacterium]